MSIVSKKSEKGRAEKNAKKDDNMRGILAAIIVGTLMPGCDTTIVAIGVSTLMDAFVVGTTEIQWVSTAYTLALAIGIPVAGWLERRRGGRVSWLAGLWVFLAGSVMCILSPSLPALVASRVVQGFAAGMIITLMTILPVEAAAARGISSVGSIMSTIMLPLSCGPIFGPVIGGVILSVASWHWLFIINVPVVALALVLGVRHIEHVPGEGSHARPFDPVGFVLVAVGITLLLLGFSEASQGGDLLRAGVVAPLLGGVAAMALFLAWPRTRDPERAFVDVGLMRYRSVPTAAASIFMAGAVLYAAQFLLPLFYQDLLGADALTAALMLLPQGVGSLLSRSFAGRLTDAHGGRVVAAGGFAATALTTAPFLVLDPDAPALLMGAVLFLRGLAVGMLIVPITTCSYTSVPDEAVPDTAVIVRMFQQVGGSFGTAVVAAVLAAALAGAPSAARGAFVVAFAVVVGASALGALFSLTMPRPRRHTSS